MRAKKAVAEEQFTQTRSRLTELGSSFKGKTASAFDAKFEEWRTSATDLLTALDGLSQFLDNAANSIEQVDADIASQLG
jgi:WXG100 family type VII secretion target